MPGLRSHSLAFSMAAVAGSLCLFAIAETHAPPSIEFTLVPPSAGGNSIRIDMIAGRVHGAAPGQKIVIFAKSGATWWVQPRASQPFTDIQSDSRWKGVTHPGTVYAALLVDQQYTPPAKIGELPEKGKSVLAVATAIGPAPSPPKEIQFSGYPWRVREAGRLQSGQTDFYEPGNVWIDQAGCLHLRVTKRGDEWLCSEVTLSRSLGYGTYRFVVRDISHLDPAAVLIVGPAAKMAIELSRWGRQEDKNAQYVITPYMVPANTVRFMAPRGTLSHWLEWKADQATFRTVRGSSPKSGGDVISEHTFTSGVQSPGNEGVSLNLYIHAKTRDPLKHAFEVIIEKFEFFP